MTVAWLLTDGRLAEGEGEGNDAGGEETEETPVNVPPGSVNVYPNVARSSRNGRTLARSTDTRMQVSTAYGIDSRPAM